MAVPFYGQPFLCIQRIKRWFCPFRMNLIGYRSGKVFSDNGNALL